MRIGVDLGGSKIEVIALDDDRTILWRERTPTPRGNYPATIEAIRDGIAAAERATGRAGTIGVGIPGAISPASGLVKNANSIWLNGRPLHRDLAAALGRPVRVANDADCFALSEATDGAGAGAGTVFGAILGTGVGGGLVIGGQLLAGPNAIAGEWGHNPLPWPADDERPGPSCYCGQSGCIETFLSGPGLARSAASLGGGAAVDDADAMSVVARADAGDETARRALALYADRLARGLAAVINIVDPDVVVLGGGLSNMAWLYDAVPKLWPRWVFSDRVATRLLPPVHGDSSGVRGAAWLWPAEDGAQETF
jgi:fructokinase